MKINSQVKYINKKYESNIEICENLALNNLNLNFHYDQNNSNTKETNEMLKNYETDINLTELSNIIHNGLEAERFEKNNKKMLQVLKNYEKKQLELEMELIKQIESLITIKIYQIDEEKVSEKIEILENEIKNIKGEIFYTEEEEENNNNNNNSHNNSHNNNKYNNGLIEIPIKMTKERNYNFTKLSNGRITIEKLSSPKSYENLNKEKLKNKYYQLETTETSTTKEQSFSENIKISKGSILKERIEIIKKDILERKKFSLKIEESIECEISNMKIELELLDEEISKNFGKNVPCVTPNPRISVLPNEYQTLNCYSKKSKSSLSSPVDKVSPRSKNKLYRPSIFIKSRESNQVSPKLETKISDLKYRSQSPFSYFHQEKSQTKYTKIQEKASQYRESCFDYFGKENRNSIQLKSMKRDKYFQKCSPFAERKN